MRVRPLNDNEIVMVDDSETDIFLTRRFLKKSQLRNPFISFSNGPDFLDYMEEVRQGRQRQPALVLLDINMPVMTGFDVLKRLREHPEFHDVPVVSLYTNSSDPREKEKAAELGATFIEKFSSTSDAVSFFDAMVGR